MSQYNKPKMSKKKDTIEYHSIPKPNVTYEPAGEDDDFDISTFFDYPGIRI